MGITREQLKLGDKIEIHGKKAVVIKTSGISWQDWMGYHWSKGIAFVETAEDCSNCEHVFLGHTGFVGIPIYSYSNFKLASINSRIPIKYKP